MRLPRADAATCDLRKLTHYCLDATHPRGRHKARVFRQALGITLADADWLRQALLDAAAAAGATEIAADAFGRRWRVDVPIARPRHAAVVRTVWMIRSGETIPGFVSCWVV